MDILTQILKRFTIYLEDMPANLRLLSHSLLFFLLTIDIALTIYNNIDNIDFSYIKWAKNKILKVGFILFAINKYEWILAGVKSFFVDVAEKAIRTNLFDGNEYFENPSLIFSKGSDLASEIYDDGVSWYSPSTWIYIIFCALILIGFLILAIQIIISWIEYYFLTGISIVFLPFGALDMGLEYYKNVFKTIISCSIKLCVMNFWLRLATVILNDLFKISRDNIKLEMLFLIFGVVYVLVSIMQFLPSMTTGLLTGSPTVNASATMGMARAGAMSLGVGIGAAIKRTLGTAKETVKGTYGGAKKGYTYGGMAGSAIGSLGGPKGTKIGQVVGKVGGAVVGGTVGGTYAGARYATTGHTSSSSKTSNGTMGGTGSKVTSGGTSSSTSSTTSTTAGTTGSVAT